MIVRGKEFIPEGKPIIFAPNHQNALMDPLAIACSNKYQSNWLARADIFKSEKTAKILRYLKLLPVYRIRDGKDNLSNNEQIFKQVTHLLESNETVALFPEAAHSGRRQMLPHKKAIPRIALETEAKNNFELNLQIVPVGIYYSHYWEFNRSLIVEYGKPISIGKYREEFAENPQKAMLSLRDEIYAELRPLTLQIESENHYDDCEKMRQLAGEPYAGIRKFHEDKNLQLFYAEKELMLKIHQLEIKNPAIFTELTNSVSGYFREIDQAGISDLLIRKAPELNLFKLMFSFLLGILSLPVFCMGFLFNALPFFVPRTVLRNKVKNKTFLSTFNFGFGLIVFPLFYLLESGLVFYLTRSVAISVTAILLMPFAGKYGWQLHAFYRETLDELKIFSKKRKSILSLSNRRITIVNRILEIIG